ncbi:MAG: hypothetical protein MJ211_11430 [Bacteroidales bacterium]|nr:hypothetical protein [Bacteroidales bacterium]
MSKNNLITKFLTLFAIIFILAACRSDFNFEEFDKLDDSLTINGKIAIPLINSNIKFSNIKKAEINPNVDFTNDENNLTHIIINQDKYEINCKNNVDLEYITDKEYVYKDEGKERKEGEIRYKDPVIYFKVNSEENYDINVKIKKIDFYNKENRIISTINYNNLIGKNEVIINNEVSEGKLTECLNLMPEYYKITFVININSDKLDNKINIESKIDLPIDVILGNFSIEDESEFNLSEYIDNIENLEIKCKAENETQIQYDVYLYFANSKEIIDSVFIEGAWRIESAKLNNGNIIIEKAEKNSIIPKERLTKIAKNDCNILKYKIIMKTESSYVKVTSKQSLYLRVSLLAELGYTNK